MPLGHYLSVGKLKLGSALSEGAERDKSLALMSGRSARRLRLRSLTFSPKTTNEIGGQRGQDTGTEKDRALTTLSEIGVIS
jgi:hypothetical protein